MPFTDMQNMSINMTNNMSSSVSICLIWKGYIFDISVILVICTDNPLLPDGGGHVCSRTRNVTVTVQE